MHRNDFVKYLKQTYSKVVVIVSPPRCSSTALSRVFWEHPQIRYYSHEPFEASYYLDENLDDVFGQLKNPLDLRPLKMNSGEFAGRGIVIKEMPYQVGEYFETLANFATAPIIFLIRDPRLNIASRMKKKEEVGDSPLFPLIETGWKLLESQVTFCETAEIPFLVVDSRDFRNHPQSVLKKLFNQLHLSFSEELLTWKHHLDIDIDNLDGKHTHLYRKVLQSGGLIPDDVPIPSLEFFPEDGGFRQHVIECLEAYKQLRENKHIITP